MILTQNCCRWQESIQKTTRYSQHALAGNWRLGTSNLFLDYLGHNCNHLKLLWNAYNKYLNTLHCEPISGLIRSLLQSFKILWNDWHIIYGVNPFLDWLGHCCNHNMCIWVLGTWPASLKILLSLENMQMYHNHRFTLFFHQCKTYVLVVNQRKCSELPMTRNWSLCTMNSFL